MLKKSIAALVAMGILFGCASPNSGPREASGGLIGGAAGALIGSQFGKGHGQLAAVAIGALLGAAVGSEIGRDMDEQDKQLVHQTAQRSLEYSPDNQVSSWHNPNKAHSGNFVVTKTQEYPQTNKVCRDFVNTVVIDGQTEKVHGRACRDVRDPRGYWEIQS